MTSYILEYERRPQKNKHNLKNKEEEKDDIKKNLKKNDLEKKLNTTSKKINLNWL